MKKENFPDRICSHRTYKSTTVENRPDSGVLVDISHHHSKEPYTDWPHLE
jgi:hypothetical protein